VTQDAATTVPKALFQFWDKPELPKDLKPLVISWAEHSEMDIRMYHLDSARQFISDAFGAGYLACFDKCAIPAMKSDFFRFGVCQTCCPPISCGVSDFRGADFDFGVEPDGSDWLPVAGFS